MTSHLKKLALTVGLALFLIACEPSAPAAAPLASMGVTPPTASGPQVQPDIPPSTPPPDPVPAPTALPFPKPESVIYILDPNGGERISHILAIDPGVGRQTFGGRTTRYVPDVAFSSDGRRMYVADTYWTQVVRGEARDVLSVYDTLTGQLLTDDLAIPGRLKYKAFPMGDPFLFLSEDGSRVFLMKYGNPDIGELRLVILDPNTLGTLHEGRYPPCGRRVQVLADRWICASTTGSVDTEFTLSLDALDPQSGALLDHLMTVDNADAYALDLSGDGKKLYVVGRDATVTTIDLPGRTVLGRTRVAVPPDRRFDSESTAVSPDGRRLYLGFAVGGQDGLGQIDEIRVYDPATWEQLAVIEVGDPVMHFALSADSGQLYAVSPDARSLMIYDTSTYEQVAVLSDLGGSPARVVVPPTRP